MRAEMTNVQIATAPPPPRTLTWRNVWRNLDLHDMTGRRFLKELFHACRFEKLAGVVFERCCLMGSSWKPRRAEDMLGVTVTMDCFTFEGLEMNELAFDAFLYMLVMTRGNDAKRDMVRRLIDPRHLRYFEKAFPQVGTEGGLRG